MSTATASPEPQGFLDKHHFLLRRLHSLTGIVPIGMFLMFHLFTNMQMAAKPLGMEDAFQHEVEWIHGTIPAMIFVEIFGLWLPIAFHAGLGILYTFTGKNNVKSYRYYGNVRYVAQRVTGIIALIFVFLHVATLRWGWDIFGWYTPFYVYGHTADGTEVPLSSASLALALQGGLQQNLTLAILVSILYILGAYSAVFHWANGLWTSAITWGVTTSVQSMRRWGYVCAAVGVSLSIFTAFALWGSWAYELSPAELEAMQILIEGTDPALVESATPVAEPAVYNP
ncbi:hypothetical protein [Mucisphaera sp.]|uniref:hypothetical protein n=1 Tax=Mucisphaera sp. TaxID=2913024 RepID=UPI003D0B07AD